MADSVVLKRCIHWACLAALLLLGACGSIPTTGPASGPATAPSSAPPPSKSANAPARINMSGYPPEFRQGYEDGCASAGARAKGGRQVRNEARFKADLQYASGWRDGFDMCGR
jgi:hypothetical protein